MDDGRVQRQAAARTDGQLRLSEPNAVGLREAAHVLDAAFFVVLLFMAVPKDRARRNVWKFGRRLRGPELVTTAEFNGKLGRKKLADDATARTD